MEGLLFFRVYRPMVFVSYLYQAEIRHTFYYIFYSLYMHGLSYINSGDKSV